jgi:DNA repair protein RadC
MVFFLIAGCAAQYEIYEPVSALPPVYNQDSINRYLLTHYQGLGNEQARVIYFRDDKYLFDEISNGGTNNVAVNGLQIVINCAVKKCNRVILAHNHPGEYFGRASGIDLDNADKFKDMMKQANITPSYVILGNSDANWLY